MTPKLTAIYIALATLLASAWLGPQYGGNVQVVTRLGLSLNIVQLGVLNIDRFEKNTVDKALVDGHYYSDKAPGHSFFAVPAVAIANTVLNVLGLNSERVWDRFEVFNRIATLWANSLPLAFAATALYLLARKLGATETGAIFGALSMSLATPLLGWSTAFFAHSLSASLLICVMTIIAFGFDRNDAGTSKRGLMSGALLGLVCGFTVAVDMTTGPVLAASGLLALFMCRNHGLSHIGALASTMAVAAVIGALPLLAYNFAIFGNPVKLAYSAVVGFEGMKEGFFGISAPEPAILWEILFGTYRGLLPLSPILLLAPIGAAVMLKHPESRHFGAFAIMAVMYFLLLNAGYHYWNGGFSTGPRHLTPAIPFLALALAFAWPKQTGLQFALMFLLVPSLALSLVCANIDMFAPDNIKAPLTEYLLPRMSDPKEFLFALPVLVSWGIFAALIYLAEMAEGDGPPATPPPQSATSC